MKIKFVEHAKLGADISAKKGRKAKEKIFEYGKEWLGNVYQ